MLGEQEQEGQQSQSHRKISRIRYKSHDDGFRPKLSTPTRVKHPLEHCSMWPNSNNRRPVSERGIRRVYQSDVICLSGCAITLICRRLQYRADADTDSERCLSNVDDGGANEAHDGTVTADRGDESESYSIIAPPPPALR